MNCVSPRVGAWIEIYSLPDLYTLPYCRSPRGSVD